jgi:hypothetical protein
MTTGSPKPARVSCIVSMPVKYSASDAQTATTAAGTGFHTKSTIAAAMIASVMIICVMWLAPSEAYLDCCERLMLQALTKQCGDRTTRDGVFPASFSIAQCGTLAARIGSTLEEPLFAIDADSLGVPEIVVPIGDHLNRLAAPFQLPRDLIRDAAFE